MSAADVFPQIADMFRRRKFKAALGLINSQLENYVEAAMPLDSLSLPPTDTATLKQSLRCSSDEFILQILAAIFPLCVSQIARHDCANLPAPFPKSQDAALLERLYLLLDWCRHCVAFLRPEPSTDASLLKLWTERHLLVVRFLVDTLSQLEIYEVALALILSDILKKQPESPLGLTMLGSVYLMMGDLLSAEYHLGIAECLSDSDEQKPLTAVTNGILQLSRGDSAAAVADFQDAVEQCRRLMETMYEKTETNKRLATGGLELAVSVNNLAVSFLYRGSVREATQQLEESLSTSTERPIPYLAALRNLTTLFEFAPQRGKKIASLHKILSEFGTDELEILQIFNTDSQDGQTN